MSTSEARNLYESAESEYYLEVREDNVRVTGRECKSYGRGCESYGRGM